MTTYPDDNDGYTDAHLKAGLLPSDMPPRRPASDYATSLPNHPIPATETPIGETNEPDAPWARLRF